MQDSNTEQVSKPGPLFQRPSHFWRDTVKGLLQPCPVFMTLRQKTQTQEICDLISGLPRCTLLWKDHPLGESRAGYFSSESREILALL